MSSKFGPGVMEILVCCPVPKTLNVVLGCCGRGGFVIIKSEEFLMEYFK